MSLADTLESAASALAADADAIRPANGDPVQLLSLLGDEGGRRVLEWLLVNEPDGGAELALAWVDVDGGPEVLSAFVATVDEGDLPKPGRKALRKALHKLRSRGVTLPERPKGEPVVARLPRIEDDFESAFVSALDPRGARLVYIAESNPSGGARMFEILLDENRGIVDFQVYSAGRSRIRKFLKEAVSRSRFPGVDATPESLRALVARVAARHPVDRVLPGSFSEWRSKLAVEGETPGDLAATELAGAGDADALARAAELVKKGSLGPWGPSPSELSERVESSLEEAAAGEPGSENWADFAERLSGSEADAAICAERFRESAYILWKLEQPDDARACLAAAEAFTSRPVAENVVAQAMAETLLTPALDAIRARQHPHEENSEEHEE